MPNLTILYQDDELFVIDKPPGLVVTPSETQKELTLADILQKDYGLNLERGGIVHRLDKDTSGLILVAKTLESFEKLQAQFKARTVQKEYLALVHGNLTGSGIVDAPIARNPENRERFIVSHNLETAREAVTEYQPVKHFVLNEQSLAEIFSEFNKIQMRKLARVEYGQFTLVSCRPKTGRTHQIRVHLKYLGFPIVGDEKYVGKKTYRLDHRWVDRQFLHASKIEFEHPVTGKKLQFESALPSDLEKSLRNLQLDNG